MTKEGQSAEPAVATDVGSMLGNIFKTDPENGENKLQQGLENLQSIPAFAPQPPPVPGKDFTPGVIGFRKSSGMLHLAIACGTAQVRYISLAKYIALIENLHDPESASIMLQNFQDKDEYKSAKGQVTARINAQSSAIIVIQGVTGRIIRSPQDIALFDVYYIDRKDLTAYYLAAKSQISTADQLETMIATYDGWKAFNVPLNPLNPYDE